MNSDYRVDIESLLYGYYIKYDKLSELIRTVNCNVGCVDIYIDLYDILKNVYNTNIHTSKQLTIVSSIINMAAHYRGFFRYRLGINTRIFLVYGEDITNNHTQYIREYKEISRNLENLNYNKIDSVIKSQLEMVKLLCGYIPDVYYIHRATNSAMFIYDNILSNNSVSFIISKSRYMYQIPAMIPNNTYILRPKKKSGEDISYLINHGNSLLYQFDKSNNDKLKEFNPTLMSCLLALNGFGSYNLHTKCNITIACSLIHQAILEGKITNGMNPDPAYVYSKLDFSVTRYISITDFKFRFMAIDLSNQYLLYSNMIESKDITWNINLYDPETVRHIANKYFIDNPLDLNNL